MHPTMQASNYSQYFDFLISSRAYIAQLLDPATGEDLLRSNRKTGFLGFIVNIDSLVNLFKHYVHSGTTGLTFLCTYKFSQDHLELLFGKIRSMGGCNNNPTARQLCAAYKKFLEQNEIEDACKGNGLSLE